MMKSDLAVATGERDFAPQQRQCSEMSLQWQKRKLTKSWALSGRVQRTTQRIIFNFGLAQGLCGKSKTENGNILTSLQPLVPGAEA